MCQTEEFVCAIPPIISHVCAWTRCSQILYITSQRAPFQFCQKALAQRPKVRCRPRDDFVWSHSYGTYIEPSVEITKQL